MLLLVRDNQTTYAGMYKTSGDQGGHKHSLIVTIHSSLYISKIID